MKHLLYKDQKLVRCLHEQLSRVYKEADKSRKRTLTWGILLALGWITVIVNMPPIQKCKSPYPHLWMMALAGGVSASVKKNYTNAVKTQQDSVSLIKKLRVAKNTDDVQIVRTQTQRLFQEYGRC